MAAIVARAPLRVALGGGGTDMPAYYRDHGGFVISTAIDRYVQMLVSPGFQERYRLKHLEWEEVDDPARIRHPILREAIARHWHGSPPELASVSDVPPGTGRAPAPGRRRAPRARPSPPRGPPLSPPSGPRARPRGAR